jgi:hypothetical protein
MHKAFLPLLVLGSEASGMGFEPQFTSKSTSSTSFHTQRVCHRKTPLMVLVVYFISRKEEVELAKEFGQEYLDYKKKTLMRAR